MDLLKYIRNLFFKDRYIPIKAKKSFNITYTQYESDGDTEKTVKHITDIIVELKSTQFLWKINLLIATFFKYEESGKKC